MAVSLANVAVVAFIVIPTVLVLLLAYGVNVASHRTGEASLARRRALAVLVAGAAWMTITWLVASSGVLRMWDTVPPPLGLFVAALLTVACFIAFGPWGRLLAAGIPLWALVATQAFRLPLELAMHGMYEQGVMPVQMSYSGWNFDIVTGTTALAVAAIARHRQWLWLVIAWNVVGLALLANIVTIAILSTPLVQYFGADRLNIWVTYPPFVWLPAVMVVAALAGHLVIFRTLKLELGTRN